jgi:hypothetical protein
MEPEGSLPCSHQPATCFACLVHATCPAQLILLDFIIVIIFNTILFPSLQTNKIHFKLSLHRCIDIIESTNKSYNPYILLFTYILQC